jgi:Chromo (CHRromatin Organisation MOdifier) domain
MLEMDGGATRVSAWNVKRCRDPTRGGAREPPAGLPGGYARYLLSHNPLAAPAPAAVTEDDVTWLSDRHGVEAVVGHRVSRDRRGRPAELQYLVRWEGAHVADTWEGATLLDACEHALEEYWNTAQAAGLEVADAGTQVVRGRLRRARERAHGGGPLARVGSGRYKLPAEVRRFRGSPTALFLESAAVEGAHVLMRWEFPDSPEAERLQWCEGIVRRRAVAVTDRKGRARGSKSRRRTLGVYFYGETRMRDMYLVPDLYWGSAEFDAPKDSWFLIGDEAALGKWAAFLAAAAAE